MKALSLSPSKRLWPLGLLLLGGGLVCWALGAGLAALWFFILAAAAVGLALPFPYALVSPLYMGVIGWLVDMLPLVILVGWAVVLARWCWGLVRERRWPRGGRWIWLPIGLVAWTAVGATAITADEIKHFALLFGIQVLASGTIIAMADSLQELEARTKTVAGVLAFLVVLSLAVLLQWFGVPVESLQDTTVSSRVEEAYGVDAFRNETGMIKYARTQNAGGRELANELKTIRKSHPEMPPYTVFLPLFDAYDKTNLVVRFDGSARAVEDDLEKASVDLIFDNVGIAPANTVPRFRSFPRNALTYAGISAALLPFGFFIAWSSSGRRKRLGQAAIVACLTGAGFALARGAWAVIAIGILYLLIDGAISWRRKLHVSAAFVGGAAVLIAVFLAKYDVDPLTARVGGKGSIETREEVYADTVGSVSGRYLLTGYGSTRSRVAVEEEASQIGKLGKFIPDAGTHSTYLNYLFRTGLPGTLILIAIYVVAAARARAASRVLSGHERTFATIATAAVVMVAAHGLVLSFYVEPIYSLTISIVLGLALAVATNVHTSILPWRRRTTE